MPGRERIRVGVTGANGFFGKYLCQKLRSENLDVIEISRSNGFNLENYSSLEALSGLDTIFHLAANTFVPDSYARPRDFFFENFTTTLNVLELCRKLGSNLVFAGSYVYGMPESLPINEQHPVKLWNPYASSKIICENLIQSYSNEFGVHASTMRIFNIYGAGQSERFLLPKILNGLRNGKLELENGSPRRDYVFATDVAEAFYSVWSKRLSGFQVFNVGSGISYSVKEIVDLAREVLNIETEAVYSNVMRPTEVPNVIADCKKIRDLTGWKPKIDLKTGLKMLLR